MESAVGSTHVEKLHIAAPHRVPHRMTVRFDSFLRKALDDIARRTGIVYADGKPRDAELVRVMLVSALLADEPASVRLAVALYVNSVLALSGFLALTIAELREALGRMTQRTVGAKRRAEVVRGERAVAAGPAADRARVFLVLDDLLHRSLVEYLSGREEETGRAPTSAAVRVLLRDVVEHLELHWDVIQGYGQMADRIRSSIREAVEVEKNRLAEALQAVTT